MNRAKSIALKETYSLKSRESQQSKGKNVQRGPFNTVKVFGGNGVNRLDSAIVTCTTL
ncbi:hypothetical protein [Peribacillus saganii]|uniref:hypothetical protein n=1 Tax=Peribacillus saganii TaxID=2303992 RepID=UPI0013149B50|nr:hypothetical protein [Peribacillus saganii]